MDGRTLNEMKIDKTIDNVVRELPYFARRWATNLKASRKTASTRYVYVCELRRFLKSIKPNMLTIKPEDITEDDILKFMVSNQTKVVKGVITQTTDSSQNKLWYIFNNFFSYLKATGAIDRNYMETIEKTKNHDLVRINQNRVLLTEDDFKKIIKAIENDEDGKWIRDRNMAIILLFMNTGMRKTALITIEINDIDFERSILTIIDKGNKRHEYILNEKVMAAINNWLKTRKEEGVGLSDPHLFISMYGKELSGKTLTNIVYKYTKRALRHELSPHKLRAGYCSILYNKTHDIEFVRRAVGHSDTSTTQRYIVTNGEEKRRAAEIMGSIL